jgi:hypothetical protein
MAPCVIPQQVTAIDHALQQLRMPGGTLTHDEERRACPVLFEKLEQLWVNAGSGPSSKVRAATGSSVRTCVMVPKRRRLAAM